MPQKDGLRRNFIIGSIVAVVVLFFAIKWKGTEHYDPTPENKHAQFEFVRTCAEGFSGRAYPVTEADVMPGGIQIVPQDSITRMLGGAGGHTEMVNRSTRTVYLTPYSENYKLHLRHATAHLFGVYDGRLVADNPSNEHATKFFEECAQ